MVALPDITAPTVARAIYDQWWFRYGIMTSFRSEGAHNVGGYVIRELYSLLGIGKSKSSRLHRQGDGLSESMVRLLKSCVQKQVDCYGSNWDLHIQSAIYAIRTSVSPSAGFTPSLIILGSNIKLPADLIASSNVQDLQQSTKNYSQLQAQQFVSQLGREVKQTFTQARATLENSRKKMKIQYERRTTCHQFSGGDYIMLWYPYRLSGISKV